MLHMVRKWPLSGSEVFSGLETLHFHPTTPPHMLSKFFFQNRFWPLEKLFLLICAWEGLQTCHFRGSYLELFRPNDELPECFLADLNSLGVYLKLVRATFLIYFDIFEKKVLKIFLGSISTKSLPKSFTFQLEKVKNDEHFWFLKNTSYGS